MVLYIANKILILKVGYKNNYLADGRKDKIRWNKDSKKETEKGNTTSIVNIQTV